MIWVLAVATALMTAFYMFRLMAMTFFGGYRGPAWETAGHRGRAAAASPRRTARRIRPIRTRTARRTETDHEVTHGPAEPHDAPRARTHDARRAATATARGTARTNRRRR